MPKKKASVQKRNVKSLKNISLRVIPIIIIILAAASVFIYLSSSEEAPSQVIENKNAADQLQPSTREPQKIYNYTPGKRPDYELLNGTFDNLPPIPNDFWDVDEKFYSGQITDFVDMDEKYWKQPEFYPTFENNIDLVRNPQDSVIYAFGTGAYPGDIGVEVPPNSQFMIATFFYTSWLVETYQGIKIETVYPESADILSGDLQKVNFTVKQDPARVGQYFDVKFDPEVFLLGPSAPVFDENWSIKVKFNITVKENTPKGVYVIGVNTVVPPAEYSEVWLKKYPKYSDISGFRVGRPPFQIVVFVT